MENKLLTVGDTAPDFILQNQHKVDVNLKSLQGSRVLLSFHPLAWTRVCEIQMKTLEAKNEASAWTASPVKRSGLIP